MTQESVTSPQSPPRGGRGTFAVTSSGRTDRPASGAGRRVLAGLLLLGAIPVAAGVFRLAQLAGGAEITPANARFFASPVPVVVHIVSVILYSVLGAFQFVPALRRRRAGWHRAAGRLLVPCGLLTALTGMWMALFYPHPDDTGDLLTGIRLVVGSAMFAAVVLGFAAIRRRDIAAHRAWMTRGYALAMGAGTQAVTQLPWILLVGPLDRLSKALLMAAAWAINIAVAEWVIRRRPAGPLRTPAGPATGRPSRPAHRTGVDHQHIV